MSKTKEELIASVKAMAGKIENKGKTPEGKLSSAEFNDLVALLVELAENCSTRTELVHAIETLPFYTKTQILQMLEQKVNTDAIDGLLAGKQDVIGDLAAIRDGASSGNTAVQPAGLQSAVDTLNARIDAIIGGNATLSLSASPASIFANTSTQITVTATASIQASSIVVKKGGSTVRSGSNTTSVTFTESLSLSGGASVSYSADGVINGVNKSASSKTVRAYNKIYYGVGAENSYEGVTSYQSIRSSAAGTYAFNPVSGKQYAYILVPYAMSAINLNNVKLDSGFGYNLQLISDNVTIDSARYRVYRSAANAVGESFNVVIS